MGLIQDHLERLSKCNYAAGDVHKHIQENIEVGFVHPEKYLKQQVDRAALIRWSSTKDTNYEGIPSRHVISSILEPGKNRLLSVLLP